MAKGDAMVEQLATAGVSTAAVAGEAIRPFFLSVLQEMCELARPEIAASAIVAGACKVRMKLQLPSGMGGGSYGGFCEVTYTSYTKIGSELWRSGRATN